MKKVLNISEIAKLTGFSRRTLIYYDEIDLFKPYEIGENGYRYYNLDQLEILNVIWILKSLNMPLKDIKNFLNNRTSENIKNEFLKQKDEVEVKIKSLIEIRDSLDRFLYRCDKINNIKMNNVTLEERDEEYFLVSDYIYNYNDISTHELLSEFFSDIEAKYLFSGYPIGFLVDGNELKYKNFIEVPYRTLIKIDKNSIETYKNHTVIKKPKGLYITGFFNNEIHEKNIFNEYFKRFIDENSLEINGDIWELFWKDETYTYDNSQFIFEVSVGVKLCH